MFSLEVRLYLAHLLCYFASKRAKQRNYEEQNENRYKRGLESQT